MRIHVVGATLRIVLDHEDRRFVPDPALRDRFHQPADREVVLRHHRTRRRRAGARAVGVIVAEPDDG